MKRHGMDTPGKHLGVIGLGGLGHLAVKFGKAFGLEVSVLSTSPGKRDEALTVLGADNFIVTSNEAELKARSPCSYKFSLLQNVTIKKLARWFEIFRDIPQC
ncbi:hypothetical protein O6H91_06G029600 [Diphasiastrum complanatum]|uniref:Uncharacterized protein n=1 Tax=Diphasiastrum complanatum TaxID=34168 RepID=A0ACC2DCE9_DIPCM|nr:hypothetical protein O6H91_06G029600 [Diphasiastrum complanatum]